MKNLSNLYYKNLKSIIYSTKINFSSSLNLNLRVFNPLTKTTQKSINTVWSKSQNTTNLRILTKVNFRFCSNDCSNTKTNTGTNNKTGKNITNKLFSIINNLTLNNATLKDLKIVDSVVIEPNDKITVYLVVHTEYRKVVKLLTESQLQILELIPELKGYEIIAKLKKITKEEKDSQLNSNSNSNNNKNLLKKNLSKIKHFIAVSSCKGGVGKSTVAVNLASALKQLRNSSDAKNKNSSNSNIKIGIFDADIHGPSLPVLLKTKEKQALVYEDDKNTIIPIEFDNMKLMSYGFAAPNKKALVRGPIVSGIVSSLLLNTDWGELDYLIIDFPPGTGDIQLSLCQEVNFTGAVIVTTPQKLSFIDVVKGIEMFDDLKVPILAAVENMAYFICGSCSEKHKIFGEGYIQMMKQQFGIEDSFEIPLEKRISVAGDNGCPFILADDNSTNSNVTYNEFIRLAKSIDKKVNSVEYQKLLNPPKVVYDELNNSVNLMIEGVLVKKIKSKELRVKCGCALCVNEFTGEPMLDPSKVLDDVKPLKIEPRGNYAVTVVWSDGHRSSIYPYKKLLSNSVKEW